MATLSSIAAHLSIATPTSSSFPSSRLPEGGAPAADLGSSRRRCFRNLTARPESSFDSTSDAASGFLRVRHRRATQEPRKLRQGWLLGEAALPSAWSRDEGDRKQAAESRRSLSSVRCQCSWRAHLARNGSKGTEQGPVEGPPSINRRRRRIVPSDKAVAAVTSEHGFPRSHRNEAGRADDVADRCQAQEPPSEGEDRRRGLQHVWLTAMSVVGSINILGNAERRDSWSVPWKGDTIFQVMFLWFMAFWFIGSWLIPVITQVAGLNRAAMSLRAQALYSLSTDLAEMAVGLSILNRCLSRFRPLSAEWFRFKPRGRWYLDALFACSLFPVVQLLSRINTSLLPVSLKFMPAVRIEQSINAQDPVATFIYATTVAFCAPVWEEVVFRGFLLPSLTRYLPLWGSILASAAIFSLAHFSLQRLLPLFFLGVVLGVVFARSQNLLTSILLHSLWNCFVFLDLLI